MNYGPKQSCFAGGYSSGEKVVCSILLAFWFEYHGTVDGIDYPELSEYENSKTDVIWPGAYYFVMAVNRLLDSTSLEVIKHLLP